MQTKNAFTVLELLISMLVLMILISISNQTYHSLFSHQALFASTDRLYKFLALAKSQSIKNNQKIYVHFCQRGNTGEWRMAQSDQANCDCFVANDCSVNGVQYNQQLSDSYLVSIAESDITFTNFNTSYNTMRFTVKSGSVTLNDSSGHRLKVIQSAMRLRVCAPDNAQFGYNKC